MKVKQEVLDTILTNREFLMRFTLSLDCSEANAIALLKRNSIDGRLTTMAALKSLSEVTGIEISALLETEETVKA